MYERPTYYVEELGRVYEMLDIIYGRAKVYEIPKTTSEKNEYHLAW